MTDNLRVDAPDSRRIAAVLANDDMRLLYAQIVLAGSVGSTSPATTKKALAALIKCGLVESTDGRLSAPGRVFPELLAQHPPAVIARGVDRFLRGGKIDRYPSSAVERRELLVWVAAQAMGPGEVLSERDVNERLERFSDDVAALRRYLIDAEVLERTRSGSSYSLVVSGSLVEPGSFGAPGNSDVTPGKLGA